MKNEDISLKETDLEVEFVKIDLIQNIIKKSNFVDII